MTVDQINAAVAANDISFLERAFCAFVAFPNGEGFSGFDDSEDMLSTFTDVVCPQLNGDFNPIPTEVFDVFLNFGNSPFQPTFRDASAAAVRLWHYFVLRLTPITQAV